MRMFRNAIKVNKKKFNNAALNLQLSIVAEISEMLKNRGVNINSLNVDLKSIKKKKKVSGKEDQEIVNVNGKIIIEINSSLNEKTSVYKMDEEEEEDETLDEDYLHP